MRANHVGSGGKIRDERGREGDNGRQGKRWGEKGREGKGRETRKEMDVRACLFYDPPLLSSTSAHWSRFIFSQHLHSFACADFVDVRLSFP